MTYLNSCPDCQAVSTGHCWRHPPKWAMPTISNTPQISREDALEMEAGALRSQLATITARAEKAEQGQAAYRIGWDDCIARMTDNLRAIEKERDTALRERDEAQRRFKMEAELSEKALNERDAARAENEKLRGALEKALDSFIEYGLPGHPTAELQHEVLDLIGRTVLAPAKAPIVVGPDVLRALGEVGPMLPPAKAADPTSSQDRMAMPGDSHASIVANNAIATMERSPPAPQPDGEKAWALGRPVVGAVSNEYRSFTQREFDALIAQAEARVWGEAIQEVQSFPEHVRRFPLVRSADPHRELGRAAANRVTQETCEALAVLLRARIQVPHG